MVYYWKYLFANIDFLLRDGKMNRSIGRRTRILLTEDPRTRQVHVEVKAGASPPAMLSINSMCSTHEINEKMLQLARTLYPNGGTSRQTFLDAVSVESRIRERRTSLKKAYDCIGTLVQDLQAFIGKFRETFDLCDRKLTPDGVLIGSIGEVYAANKYELALLRNGSECHDAVSEDGRLVQVKLTLVNDRVGVSGEPEHLLVLRHSDPESFQTIYNGPGSVVTQLLNQQDARRERRTADGGRPLRNRPRQRQISLHALRQLNERIRPDQRLSSKPPDQASGANA